MGRERQDTKNISMSKISRKGGFVSLIGMLGIKDSLTKKVTFEQ